ncbi:hypothetical protein Tco_0829295, partial [Tanacetum coccineum]
MLPLDLTTLENATTTTTEDPQSHTKGETDVIRQEKSEEPKHSTDASIKLIGSSKPQLSITQAQPITIINPEPIIPQREGKGIATDDQVEDQRKPVKALSIICPGPDALIPYTINGEVYYLTTEQLQAHMDKEERIKKAEEDAKLYAISKPEVIKVVREEAKKLGIHPKEAITTQAGENFKKAQDAEHEVLKRKHVEKVKKSLELRKHKGTDGRNFNVHNPFLFGEFGISELDELREIIPTKKNVVLKDLMNYLARRYERIRKIPEELGIKSALPAPVPASEQASSKFSRKKRKHMELEPEVKLPGLECNRTLPKNVLFVNNMVIEEPEYEILFADEFGDQAFQRWSDIDKVGMEALVSYLAAASLVNSRKNARFDINLRKLIAKHLVQEKL